MIPTTKVQEIFKSIPNYPNYEVSNLGNIKSINYHREKREVVLKGLPTKGYLHIGIYNLDGKKRFSIHRLVAETFIPNPKNKPQINHINGIKTDNRVENLEWCTAKENTQHAFRTGLKTMPKGEKHPNVKLTYKQVLEIRSKYIPYKYTQQMLANEYKVNRITIRDAILNITWK